ncbi:hypothetical protein D3C78_950530 [compost metagenome]
MAVLDRLVGMPLSPSPSAAYAYVRANEQCTHLFDAAALAVAHAKRGTPLREYDVDVPVVDASTPRIITVRRNGERVMNWVVGERTQILGPGIFAGKDIRSVLSWADGELGNPDDVEAVFVLRRAWLVSGCRNFDMDGCTVASVVPRARMAACHIHQLGVAERADRNRGGDTRLHRRSGKTARRSGCSVGHGLGLRGCPIADCCSTVPTDGSRAPVLCKGRCSFRIARHFHWPIAPGLVPATSCDRLYIMTG